MNDQGLPVDSSEHKAREQPREGEQDETHEADPDRFGSLANVRHTLRTPLNHIIGYSEMLLEEAEERELEGFVADLHKVRTAGKQLATLINSLLAQSLTQPVLPEDTENTADLSRDLEPGSRPMARDRRKAAETPSGRLLVVDDNETNRDMLRRRLEGEGHTVYTAEDGRQALELVETQPVDLVLLDVMMPVMNGYEVLEHLKANSKWRDIPVIMISALDEIASVVRCIERGAEDYLPKPFDPVLLRARVGACLEKKRLRDIERLYAERMERELQFGRRIQSSFFPAALPQLPGWEIAAHFQAAYEVSGDFYDVFLLSGGKKVGMVIADVCDKGVGAALFMALFRTLMRVFSGETHLCEPNVVANQESIVGTVEPEGTTDLDQINVLQAIQLTNNYVAQYHGEMSMFATLFFGVLDLETGLLAYINGGHEPPIIVGPDGVKGSAKPTGPAVGLLPDAQFTVQQVQLEPGDILIGYTDGVTEASSPSGELFTKTRLQSVLEPPASSASDLLDRVKNNLLAHTGNAPQADDITLLAVRRAHTEVKS